MSSAGQETFAAQTIALLREAGVQLALAEAGTGGAFARLICTPEGAAVVTRARAFATAEEMALALRVSPAKVAAFGPISAMVAAEAAAELIDTYEGGWGLLVALGGPSGGNRHGEPGVQTSGGAGASECFVALSTPSVTIIQQCTLESIARIALELLQEQAQRRLKSAKS